MTKACGAVRTILDGPTGEYAASEIVGVRSPWSIDVPPRKRAPDRVPAVAYRPTDFTEWARAVKLVEATRLNGLRHIAPFVE